MCQSDCERKLVQSLLVFRIRFLSFGLAYLILGEPSLFKEAEMKPRYTAKNKLNQAHYNGALVLAGIVGLGSGSFLVFFIALAICLGMSFHSGGIRG